MNKRIIKSELYKIAKDIEAFLSFEKYKELHPSTNYKNEQEYMKAMGQEGQQPKKDPDEKKHIEKEIADKAVSDMTKTRQKQSPVSPHKKKLVNKKSIGKVKNILSANGIGEDSDELKELAGFKDTLGQRVSDEDAGQWYVRNIPKLKKDFTSNMDSSNYPNPEAFQKAKERISKMSTADFGKMLAAVMSDETEENFLDWY